MDATVLVKRARDELRETEEALRSHPFLAAVERGDAQLDALVGFAAEQLRVIASDRRSFGHLAGRFPEPPAGPFFLDLAGGESVALGHLPALAGALGAAEEELRAHEPRPGCQAYPAFVAWLALNGGPADVALAFLVNLAAWGEACGRLAAALRGRHALTDEQVAFLDFFASPPEGFEDRCLAVIGAALAAGDEPGAALRAARLLQAYELLFWDTLAAG